MDGKEAGHGGQKAIDPPNPSNPSYTRPHMATHLKKKRKIARKSQKKRSGSGRRANRRREIKMRGYCGGVDSAAAAAAVVGRGRDEGGGGGGGWVCLALY